MVNKAWRIIPRPILESVLNNHVQHHRVPQPLILHGPRGVGKTTLLLERLLDNWNKGPHLTGYVDFAQAIQDHHPLDNHSFPWSSWSNCPPPPISLLKTQLENCLESMTEKGIKLGSITSTQIFTALNKWHGLNTALRRILQSSTTSSSSSSSCSLKKPPKASKKVSSTAVLWERAVFSLSARLSPNEIETVVGLDAVGSMMSLEEKSYLKEAIVALRLAKEIIRMQQGWRANAFAHLNRTGGFSRSLVHSATDWPSLLIDLLSNAAEIDHFQPKLVINNIDILRNAVLTDDSATVPGSMYHDSLLWRIIALGANERCLPVILVTSSSYYSYRAFMDFGFPDIFISRETFGWTPQEAKLHMVDDFFNPAEWTIITEVLGSNPRHLFEIYALKQSNHYQQMMGNGKSSTFEDIVDAYLSYLQITVVNPAMDKALSLVEMFARDAFYGNISKDRLRFGAPWRHPPHTDDPAKRLEWSKIQLLDFIQALINADFGLNYLADCSLEIFDDPSAVALLEVGLLYAQRDPSFVRPVSRAIQRCLVRWLVQERMQMNLENSMKFVWQRFIRGRSYRHLMLGYKS